VPPDAFNVSQHLENFFGSTSVFLFVEITDQRSDFLISHQRVGITHAGVDNDGQLAR
jgi:hypothetical protein